VKKGQAGETCDLLVANAYVLTMDGKRRVIPNGAIAITGRKIVAVGAEAELRKQYRAKQVLDCGGATVHPGLIDTHYHTTLHTTRGAVTDDPNAFAGLGDKPHPYAVWFNKLTDEDEQASARHAAAEALLNGVTCLMEAGTVFEPDIAADSMQSVGLRGSVTDPFMWDVTEGFPMTKQIERAPCSTKVAMQRLGSQLWRNKDEDALVGGHITLYGMGTCSTELTVAGKRAADEAGVVFTQHQNFEPDDSKFDDKRWGKHGLVHLAEIGALGENSLFVHMNFLRDDEVEAIVSSGMSITWHPGNYQFYGLALAQRTRMPELIKKGVNLTFGTDAAKVWTFGEMARIAYLVAREEGGWVPCETLLEMQTIGAAKAVCRADDLGSIEPGKRADIVIRRNDLGETNPALDPVRELMLISPAKSVDTVIVDGRVVVRHGRLTLADEAEIYGKARASARRVAAAVGLKPGTRWANG
jgi:5-methylthioadenosine/S-adenosylhomocysteine deaminase